MYYSFDRFHLKFHLLFIYFDLINPFYLSKTGNEALYDFLTIFNLFQL